MTSGCSREVRKAFDYESGQFLCHVYATIPESQEQVLDDVITLVERRYPVTEGWVREGTLDENKWHMTLVRGHRAVYYHQIRDLVGRIRSECMLIQPFNICLDTLKIFHNYEKTKQFLCMVCNQSVVDKTSALYVFKTKLREIIDQYAIKLTCEDETTDSLAHCSLMSRETSSSRDNQVHILAEIERLCSSEMDELPVCIVRVDSIHVKIGNRDYEINLKG